MADRAALIHDFSKKSSELEEELKGILETLKEGRAPSEEDSLNLTISMSRLRKVYAKIKTEALSIDSAITADQPIGIYKQLFDNYEASRLTEQVDSLIAMLSRFAAVISESPEYQAALAPYQDEVEKTINQLKSEDIDIESKIEITCENQEMFLEAISMEDDDLSSDKGERLLDLLDAYYSRKVVRGVLLGQYKESTADADTADSAKNGAPEPAPNVDFAQEEAPITESDSMPEFKREPDSRSKRVNNLLPTAPVEPADVGEPEPGKKSIHNDDIKTASGQIMSDAERKEQTVVIESLDKVKKPGSVSAASFKKELTNMPMMVRDVLPFLSKFGAMNEEQVIKAAALFYEDWDNDNKEDVKRAIEALKKKNLFAAFETDGFGIVYVLTSYGRSLLDKASIQSLRLPKSGKLFWHMPLQNHALKSDGSIAKDVLENAASQTDLAVSYLETVRKKLDVEGFCRVYSSVTCVDGGLETLVVWGYQDFMCQLSSSAEKLRPTDNLLLVIQEGEMPDIEAVEFKNVFLADGTSLRKWDNGWIGDGTDARVDDPSEAIASITPAAGKNEDTKNKQANKPISEAINAAMGEKWPTEGLRPESTQKDTEESSDQPGSPLQTEMVKGPAKANTEQPFVDTNLRGPLAERLHQMAGQDSVPSDKEFVEVAYELLSDDTALIDPDDEFSNLAGAITLLSAAATINDNKESALLLDQLILATDLDIKIVERTGGTIARSFPVYTSENEALIFAAYCFSLFSPCMAYDFDLKNAVEIFLGDFEKLFPSLVAFKPLLNELSGIRDISPEEGLSDNVLDMMGNQAKRTKRLTEMKSQATALLSPPKIKAKLHGIPEFSAACFGRDSELRLCMEIIADDNRKDRDFVKSIYNSYCIQGEAPKIIDMDRIENKIDDMWRAACEGKSTSRIRKLGSEPRKKAQDGFRDRLALMQKWLSYDDGKVDSDVLFRLKAKRNALMEIVDELESAGTATMPSQGAVVLRWMLKSLGDRLHAREANSPIFASLLKTGYISLDDDMLPVIDGTLNRVLYYEPWRNAIKHLSSPMRSFEEVRELILDSDSEFFDNLMQLSHVNALIANSAAEYEVTPTHIEQAEKAAEGETEKFQDRLEIYFAYGLINEIQKEDLASCVSAFQDLFFSGHDYGRWRQFLKALSSQVDAMAAPQGKELRTRLDGHKAALKRDARSSLLEEAERLLVEERNFTVVEDYLNRYEGGQAELTDELSIQLHDPDLFSEFISDEVFKPLYDFCIKSKGTPLPSFGKSFIKNRYPADWTTRQKESSENLVASWPIRSDRYKGEMLAELMKSIGFKVRGVPEQVKKEKRELYRVIVKPEVSDRTDYRHPISAFGTQVKSPMNVLILYGHHTPQEIIDVVAAESIVGIAIVFINYPISLADRRQMAEIFHTRKSRLTSFLLVDQVLALHLALHQETERMPLMLKCTLPFTYYQPFVRDGGPTADEMFCGRERELQTIIDPNGASVVYGGRQLGKTALLERAKSLRMKPENKEYAVYVSILSCDNEESVSLTISEAMRRAKLNLPDCRSLREVCKGIDDIMRTEAAARILLLIDESDNFLSAISDDGYMALQPMVELKRATKNNFKFVLAGLHNVSRAKNATAKNGIFGQLGEPLCIKPLTPNEALQLISRPLTYLGFQVDRYPHLETILTSTNYYPGILQFFGYTLVETMTKQYGDYYRAADGNPPYTLHREQLGAIMNRADLNNSIKEKFRWSLELDPRYFMIARCIALMCYDSEGQPDSVDIRKGFLADEIKTWADDLGILCLQEETPQSYANLLDEMVDMGILVKPIQDVARYRLRRNSFLNIIGSDLDTVLEDIDANNVVED